MTGSNVVLHNPPIGPKPAKTLNPRNNPKVAQKLMLLVILTLRDPPRPDSAVPKSLHPKRFGVWVFLFRSSVGRGAQGAVVWWGGGCGGWGGGVGVGGGWGGGV